MFSKCHMLITATDVEERDALFNFAKVNILKDEAQEHPGHSGNPDGYRQHLLTAETVVM